MSLQPAEVVADGDGAGFLNLENLVAAQGPMLLIARIVEHKAPEQNPHGGTNWPSVADVAICSGPMQGEAYLAQSFIRGAQTRTLRGVPAPKPGELAQPPKNVPGAELGIKAEYKSYRKPDGALGQYLVFNPPSPQEYAQIQAVYAGGQVWAAGVALTVSRVAALVPPVNGWQEAPAYVPPAPAAPPAAVASWPAPPASVDLSGIIAPAAPPQVPADQAAAFAAWQAQQAAAQAPPAPEVPAMTPAGPPAARPWAVGQPA